MSPEQLQLAEKISRETDPAKLTELVAELCQSLDRNPHASSRSIRPANGPTPR
jgi:hypothetical protein